MEEEKLGKKKMTGVCLKRIMEIRIYDRFPVTCNSETVNEEGLHL
jgi:hypothetical protein